jgi:DNA invertase Pin-like site-specific DNA recombinase
LVSVTQPLNTSSLGRLTLNILLSFAQFEREMIADRTRDKMAAARRKGKWVGGIPTLFRGVTRTLLLDYHAASAPGTGSGCGPGQFEIGCSSETNRLSRV